MARNVVATSQPLAAQAGLQMLYRGGNAVDAALAAAIALTVVEPTSNGIGGDAFAILWDGRELHGLNASGCSPAALTPERFRGQQAVPPHGWDAVTVPGAVSAWVALSKRFGKLPFEALFEPAVRYAREGFLVSPMTAHAWARSAGVFAHFPDFVAAFLPNGYAPKAGEVFRFEDQANTLERIAETNGNAFYCGALAEQMAACAKASDALLTEEDLANHQANWVKTISHPYHRVELHEIPPNGQGLAALLMLGILEHHPVADYPVDSADSLHVQIEAMKLAFSDTHRYVADPQAMTMRTEDLLNKDYLAERASRIDMKRAQNPGYGIPKRSGTVYLTAADESGMMVSLIQSNYQGFGSGIVIPGTGISMQNRGSGFTLEAEHPNQVGGSKRPFHTIIPGFLTQQGQPLMSFGVMGGPVQPQGHAQIVIRLCDYGQNPQAASDAPRWHLVGQGHVAVERGFTPEVLETLEKRGHKITESSPNGPLFFGGAQLIYKVGTGYLAASDYRRDGQAVGY